MGDLVVSDIRAGQIWRERGTAQRWRVHGIEREHLIGPLFETTVMLVDPRTGRDTLRVPGDVFTRVTRDMARSS